MDNSTFKEKQKISIKKEKKTEILKCSYFITVYVGSCSWHFEKWTTLIFQKHNTTIKPATQAKKFLTFSVTKVSAR